VSFDPDAYAGEFNPEAYTQPFDPEAYAGPQEKPMTMGERLKFAAHKTAGHLPAAGAILGGAAGLGLGAAMGIPTGPGAVLTGAAGAGLGAGLLSAAGKGLQQSIDKALGYDAPNSIEEATKEAAKTGAGDAALTAGGAMAGEVLGAAARPVASKLRGIQQTAENKIADWNARPLEATARSAQGTAGAARANASRTLERLTMKGGLPEAEQAANEAALQTPEAQDLASQLAAKARGELPEKLGQMQNAQALAEQAAADAAGARSPEAVRAAAKEMRGDALKRLATRYIIPAASGAAAERLMGGSGAFGAVAGLGLRPSARAILRAVTSPGFVAPAAGAAASMAELPSLIPIESGSALGAALSEEMPTTPSLQAVLADLKRRREQQMMGSNP
jgi:hypothetical protein